MIQLHLRPDRLLQLRFGVEPQRLEILRLLTRASDELRERDGPTDVLVDATWVGGLDLGLDVDFLSWIVVHYSRLRLFAIVVDDLACCEARLRKLELLSAKTFGVFAAELAAKHWLATQPWPDDVE
jgi:hypothetical protein